MTTQTKEAPRLFARLPNTRAGRRTLAGLREGMNFDGYRLRVLGSGPRQGNETSPPLARAKGLRLYLDSKGRAQSTAHYQWMTQALESERELNRARERFAALENDLHAAIKERDAEKRCALAWQDVATVAHAKANGAQQRLNAVPAWCLWLAGLVADLRSLWEAIRVGGL